MHFESLFALTNGRIGLRGSADYDGADGRPGCFLAGFYGPDSEGRGAIIKAIDPGYWALVLDGRPMPMSAAYRRGFRQDLDLRTATLALRATFRAPAGAVVRIAVDTCLPLPHDDLIMSVAEIAVQSGRTCAALAFGLDWHHDSGPGRLAVETATLSDGGMALARAHGTDRTQAAAYRVLGGGRLHTAVAGDRLVTWSEVGLSAGASVRVVRLACTRSGTTDEDSAAWCRARLAAALAEGHDALLRIHRRLWRRRWRGQRCFVSATPMEEEGWHYATFQLMQCPDRAAPATGLAPRGLTSDHLGGRMFFNTELFMVPCFAYREPALARALLRHRIGTLQAARRHARETGYEGARFPLEADPDGGPVPPSGDFPPLPRDPRALHVSADIVVGLHRYVAATGDWRFAIDEAFELVIDCAHFYASALRMDRSLAGRRSACRVTGFDEFHFHVDHHWATNYLARFALVFAAKVLERRGGAEGEAGLAAAWRAIAAKIYLPAPDADGVIPLFEGYFDLPEGAPLVPPEAGPPQVRSEDAQRIAAGESAPHRLVKQADVLLVMILLPDGFDRRAFAANLAYYEPRTAHASSLSLTPHGHAAALAGDGATARRLLERAVRYDLDFSPRSSHTTGIHFGAYAGAWLALLEGVLGFRGSAGALRFAPCRPLPYDEIALGFLWRGAEITVTADGDGLVVTRRGGKGPLAVIMEGQTRPLPGPRTQAFLPWAQSAGYPPGG